MSEIESEVTEVASKGKGKLNLVTNEVKGYRVHPDQWNWKVVVVKEHGPESKKAGQEYETPLGYFKRVSHAVSFLVNHVAAIEGEKEQKEVFDREGVLSDFGALKVGFEKAEKAALEALADLEERLRIAGYNFKEIGENFKAITGEEGAPEPDKDAE